MAEPVTQEQFDDIWDRTGAGKITIHAATQNYSISFTDKKTFSKKSGVTQWTDFPELDQATIAPGPVEPAKPVQMPSRWVVIRIICSYGYLLRRK